MPDSVPEIPARIYEERLTRLRSRASEMGYDFVVIYADREHSANVSYVTGFDPRFEEAMLILSTAPRPLILVGNECVGMAERAPVGPRVELFQEFSLPGQPRDRSRALGAILRDEGIGAGARVGAIAWKEAANRSQLELPAFIVDELRGAVGDGGAVENAGDLLTGAADGLRVINEAEQLAFFEYSATQTSSGVQNLLNGLRPGMTEQEAVRLLNWNGMPLSCHLMLTAGERARLGLLSPGDRVIQLGDPFTVAFGIWGALNCRAGFVVEAEDDLPPEIADYVDRLVAPYFEAIAEWYMALHVGQIGGVLHQIIERRLGDDFFGIFLNPGHQIHLDEWVNSPIYAGSEIPLRSGMAFQVDVIPATGTDYFTTNIEDGIAIADEELRAEFRSKFPDAWERIVARREFMAGSLGIELHPDVLPFSNIPAYLPPFLLRPDRVMTLAG